MDRRWRGLREVQSCLRSGQGELRMYVRKCDCCIGGDGAKNSQE